MTLTPAMTARFLVDRPASADAADCAKADVRREKKKPGAE